MKNIVAIIFTLILSIAAYAQDDFEKISPETTLFNVDVMPMYPGCENQAENFIALNKCLASMITQHVADNFNTEIAKNSGLSGAIGIHTQFIIDNTGEVIDIKVRAPLRELQEETIRVMKLLPSIIPGERDEKPINISYSLPITINI